jgi:response regulator RpfG family c-di-GMP phosphodiesterase
MTAGTRSLAAHLLIAAVASVSVGLVAQATGVLHGGEQRTVAARFGVRGASTPDDVVLVAIDDATFADLQQAWPFPRSLHGKVIDRLRAAGARKIVYDVQFTEPTTPREDGALYAAVARAGDVLLATSEFDRRGRTNVLGGDANLARAHARAAAVNLPDGFGSVLDHFPYAHGPLRSLAVAAAEGAGGPRLPRSAFGGRGAWIDFRGPPGTIRTVSFAAVLRGAVPASVLRGRVVVVGATVPSLQDVHPTPVAAEPMAGAEIQANAIWTALHRLPLRDAPGVVDVLLVLLLGAAVPLLRLRLRVVRAALAALGLGAAAVVGAQIAFDHGVLTWVSSPLLALATGAVTMVVASHLAESAARRRATEDNDVLEATVRERTRELRRTQLEILQRLSRAAEWRDAETGAHIARIGLLSQRLAQAVGLSEEEAEQLGHAAVAHDIGKLAIPDRILLKPEPLSDAERAEMQRHAAIGASMLSDSESPLIQLAETIAATHHEHWDGTGYPAGLRGADIPLAGRICGLCDVFDALVSERPYKPAWTLDAALDEIRAERGRHFDPELADVFLAIAPALYRELHGGAAGAADSSVQAA